MGKYDLVIIGSGPGGYVCGIRAAQLGLKAAVIERDKIGGVCLNIGCIPSKSLIHQAGLFRGIAGLEDLGLSVDRKGFDYSKVFDKSRKAADTLSRGVQYLLKKYGVEVIRGTGVITGRNEVSVEGAGKLEAGNIVIATGSRPREIPGFAFDEDRVLSSTGALMLKSLPKKIVILGAGAIGVEFSHILAAFGVEVHLVEMMDRILPLEDAEGSSVLERAFKKRGIAVSVSTKAVSLGRTRTGVNVELQDKTGAKTTVEADKCLVVIGRSANTEGIGLEKAGISVQKGAIPVGDWYQTSVPGIFAIGDVVPTPMLAHVASKEGEIVAEHIARKSPPPRIDPLSIPSAVYTEPEVAGFGLPEWKAKELGKAYTAFTCPYRGAGKSVAIEKTEGFVKVLLDKDTKEIIGAHAAGEQATELIHELLLARTAELLPQDIGDMIHAHPTLSEAVMETMRAAEGRAINI